MSKVQGTLDLFMEPFSLVSIIGSMNLFNQLVIATCNSVIDD